LRIITYTSPAALKAVSMDRSRIEGLLRRVAEATDTTGLIVITEVSSRNAGWGGSFCMREVTPERLARMKGVWREAHSSGVPPGLPSSFRLIEMRIGSRGEKYPRIEYNRNGFKLWFKDFSAHLAYLFAHELHHYRRYCLDMHPREGEKSADRWAAARANETGYSMNLVAVKIRRRTKRRSRRRPAGPIAMSETDWNEIKNLPSGSPVCVTRTDNRKLPVGTMVQFIRPMRASYRALVRDPAGDERLVPIEWLRVVELRNENTTSI
jgi:hypothetical protein